MEKLTFEQIREQWCQDQGFDGYDNYRDSLTITDIEYEEIAELYAAQWKIQINPLNSENYKSHTESLELYNSGAQLPGTTAYYVNMSAWGKDRGFELMSAEDAESVHDGCSFVEIDDTIPAYPLNFND